MNKIYWILAVVGVVLVAVFVIRGSSHSAPGNIRVGVLLPLSGQYASLGESARNAILLAAGQDKTLSFVFEDTAFDATKAVSAYKKLTQVDHVDALINLDSVSLSAIQPLVEKDNLLTFHLTEAGTHAKDPVFQLMPYSYPIFETLGEDAGKKFNKIALIYANGDPFITDADFFRKGLPDGEIVYEAKLSPGGDYRTEVTKLKALGADATTVILSQADGIKFLSALKAQQGNTKTAVICDANIEISIAAYVEALGRSLFDGCISTNLPSQMTPAFIAAYKNAYDGDPQFTSDYAYDAVAILKELESKQKGEWFSVVEKESLDGVSGHIQFDDTGTRLPAVARHIFKEGSFVEY